jgi:twinkle protein
VRLKVRGAGKQNKKYMRQLPAGAQKGFFGLNLIKDSDNTVVLTEGEFDAMAVYQQTGIPALSLPQGASNLSEGFLPYLKRFEKIVLWMDNDDAGALNTSKMVEKLGVNRTAIVRHSFAEMKDANDFLLSAPNRISELVHKARTIPDSSLLSFSALRDSIFAKISKTEENNGLKVSWLPFFNKVVKGVRMGELSVVSGPTGSGKTTLLSQITLDLCKKDITVLWGSFEIRNEILITSMMYQFADLRLDKRLEKYEHFADKFSRLPLHFMDFYGSHSIEKILSTIIYSIEKHNVHVVVIDTLQFLLS